MLYLHVLAARLIKWYRNLIRRGHRNLVVALFAVVEGARIHVRNPNKKIVPHNFLYQDLWNFYHQSNHQ